MLKAVREALDDDIAEEALKVAIEELRKRIDAAEPSALAAQLSGLDAKIERVLDLAIDGGGDLPGVKERLRLLRADWERVAGELARARTSLPVVADLMPPVREKLRQIEATIQADVAQGRAPPATTDTAGS